MNDYDVMIAGAGPAGLYLAKELSRHFRVLLIEKEEAGTCHKVWLAWKENVLRHDLEDCVLCRPTRLTVGSRTNGLSTLSVDEGDYVAILDERRLLTKWADEARDRGAHILERCEFTGARQGGKRIFAETNQRAFAGRLLIDATGCFSPVVSKARIAQEKYYYSFYGWIAQLDHVDLDELILVQSFVSKKPRPYVFFYPIDARTGAPIIFFITEQPISLEDMRKEFRFHLEQVPEVVENLAGFRPIEEKYGYVPLGRLTKGALDRILMVGDAGRLAPATIGSGFNFVLSAYHYFVPRIEEALRQNNLSGRHLRRLTRVPRWMEDNLLAQKLGLYDILNCRDFQMENPMETRMHEMTKGCSSSDIIAVLKAEATLDQLRSIVAHQAGEFSLGHLKGVLQLLREEPSPARLLGTVRLLKGLFGGKSRQPSAVSHQLPTEG